MTMFKFFERPSQEEPTEDDHLLPGELPEAITGNSEDGWKTAGQAQQEALVSQEEDRENEALEAVGGPETPEERQQRIQREEENRHDKNLYEGWDSEETLYDQQIASAQKGQIPPDGNIKQSHEDIEEKFDQEMIQREREEKLRSEEAESRKEALRKIGRIDNSKPIAKDHRNGVELEDLAA